MVTTYEDALEAEPDAVEAEDAPWEGELPARPAEALLVAPLPEEAAGGAWEAACEELRVVPFEAGEDCLEGVDEAR